MAKSPRVMIISAKVGAGHMRAAEALEEAFRDNHPGARVKNTEVLEHANAAFRRTFTGTYNRLASKLPSIWEYIYEKMEGKPVDSKTKRLTALFDRLNTRALLKVIGEFGPDAVVCTHYLPAEILAHQRQKASVPGRVHVVLTDYDIHTMWIQNGVDHYFVATEEMAYALASKGVAGAAVSVTGIPIMRVFSRGRADRAALRRKLGLHPAKRTVLVAAGGFGLADVQHTASLLAGAAEDVQFVAVAGNNRKLQGALENVAEAHEGKIVPLGFVTNMHELMAASDFAVTKSGGLTSSECLAMGLPMVIWNPIPGQEERNADYLLEKGAAVRANSPAHLVFKVKRLLGDSALLARMRAGARRIARPNAAAEIAEQVMAEI